MATGSHAADYEAAFADPLASLACLLVVLSPAHFESVENGLILLCELGRNAFDQLWAQQSEDYVDQKGGGACIALERLRRHGFDECAVFGDPPGSAPLLDVDDLAEFLGEFSFEVAGSLKAPAPVARLTFAPARGRRRLSVANLVVVILAHQRVPLVSVARPVVSMSAVF